MRKWARMIEGKGPEVDMRPFEIDGKRMEPVTAGERALYAYLITESHGLK